MLKKQRVSLIISYLYSLEISLKKFSLFRFLEPIYSNQYHAHRMAQRKKLYDHALLGYTYFARVLVLGLVSLFF